MEHTKLIDNSLPCHSSNMGGKRSLGNIKYIVIHYTANDGDTDEANIKYFNSPNRKASCHFFVDNNSISKSVEVDRVAWHCGGSLYSDVSKTGGGKLYKRVTNSNSIGIEMCDPVRDGRYSLDGRVKDNVIKLVRALMVDFGIDINHVVRHFDVTGKHCPVYLMDEDVWSAFKCDIEQYRNPSNSSNSSSIQCPSNSSSSSNSTSSLAGVNAECPFKVKVKCELNIRKEPTTSSAKVGVIKDNGVYTIVKVIGHWGLLKSKIGYISIYNKYVSRK